MVAAHYAALEQAPERFQIVGVDNAVDVLARLVIDRLMLETSAREILIGTRFIGRDQTHVLGYDLAGELTSATHRRIF